MTDVARVEVADGSRSRQDYTTLFAGLEIWEAIFHVRLAYDTQNIARDTSHFASLPTCRANAEQCRVVTENRAQRPEPRQDPTLTYLREVETGLANSPVTWPPISRKRGGIVCSRSLDNHVATQRTSSKHLRGVMNDCGSASKASRGRTRSVCDDSGQLLND